MFWASGENLFWKNGGSSVSSAKVTQAWYGEIDDYDFEKQGKLNQSSVIGHYTALMWK